MTANSLESERQQLVARLRNIRKTYQQCVEDVSTGIQRDIDEDLDSAVNLNIEQLGRSGRRGSETIRVMDVLTRMANHYDDHLAQLRDEIRPREGLPKVSD